MASIRKRTQWRLILEDKWRYQTYPSRKQAEAAYEGYMAQGLMGLRVEPAPGGSWEARIRCKHGPELLKAFQLRADAVAWAKEREGELAKRQFVDYREADRNTLGDLLARYDRERLAGRSKEDADKCRIGKLLEHPIAQLRMAVLQASDICAYRDERKKLVKGATVTKEMELICRVIGIARAEWNVHMAFNPASGELAKRPEKEPGDERDRRLTDNHKADASAPSTAAETSGNGEVPKRDPRRKSDDDAFENDPDTDKLLKLPQSERQALLRACPYPSWYTQRKRDVTQATLKARALRKAAAPVKPRHRGGCRLWAITSFALETAMRRKELCCLSWAHVHLADGYLDLPGTLTKNRKPRIVPLTLRALRILKTQPRRGELVFATNTNTVKKAFQRARERAASGDLRFHDLRHEATSKLFEVTNLRETEIGYVTGHTDPRMLQRYYNKRAQEFVQRFRESHQ